MVIVKRKMDHVPQLEDIQIGYGGVSKTHRSIYKDNTSLNLSTVSKLKTKLKSDIPQSILKEEKIDAPKKESAKVSTSGDSRVEKSGVQILQLALKKLGIVSAAFELLELAGEEADKLTVYGIYLAARAKGAQVQGIKVDLEYLYESQTGINLVFFHDESFALLNSIEKDSIELTLGVDQVKTYSIDEFKENWNGYVISISKF